MKTDLGTLGSDEEKAIREIHRTEEFDEFYDSAETKIKEKTEYILNLISQEKVVNSKFVKKLKNSDFYEMRISVGNEYRVILFTIDNECFVESENILLLNGFMKKSTKDYAKQIRIAEKILKKFTK